MTRMLSRAVAQLEAIAAETPQPLARLRAVVRWTMQVQLAGEMPSLPSQNSSLRAALMADTAYMNLLMAVSDTLGEWIVQAQAEGQLSRAVPPEVVLYTLFARACDPVLGVLKAGGHDPDQILEWVLSTTFGGLAT
jgi:TetR/AcrR family transcriptional regulator, regulator of autoinduction and epiphytic fitness